MEPQSALVLDVEKLRKLLGLFQDGRPAATIVTKADFKQAKEIYARSHRLNEFWDDFSPRFLPSHLRTFFTKIQVPKDSPTLDIWIVHCNITSRIIKWAEMGRFVRENLEESKRMYLALADVLVSSVSLASSLDQLNELVLPSAFALGTIANLLLTYLPPQETLPPHPYPIKARLAKVAKLLAAEAAEFDSEEFVAVAREVGSMAGTELDTIKAGVYQSLFRTGKVTYWVTCEFEVKHADGTCVKLAEGERMSACGRCRCVRYCSRDHQRQDWKEHKQFCRVAAW